MGYKDAILTKNEPVEYVVDVPGQHQIGRDWMKESYTIIEGEIVIPGVGVGCVTDQVKGTGVTVLVVPPGSCGAVDISGGAPATRETPVLDPQNLVSGPDAIVLTGGSALGLQTADGVLKALQQRGRGFAVGDKVVPIVVAAAIFDLDFGLAEPPAVEDGLMAVLQALQLRGTVAEGAAGAGTGATVGKILGPEHRMKSGQGAVTLITPDGLHIAALTVVNAMGSVLEHDGTVLAGPMVNGVPTCTMDFWSHTPFPGQIGGATTLGIVVTNAQLTKAELVRVARMAQDGLSRAIDPVHTPWDGDTMFAVSAAKRVEDPGRVGALSAHAVTLAIRRAVRAIE